MAHYVNSIVDRPDQWAMREDQLTFMLLEGHHTGGNIAAIIARILNEYGISEKVCLVFMPCTYADCL
jgi:hypothetical protein